MKIEIGESLFLSWLRHVKGCQLVQTNWKSASEWGRMNDEKIQSLMDKSDTYFNEKYSYRIYKGTTSIDQLIAQAEIDVVGISFSEGKQELYAIDVAFHEAGLNYGSKDETVMRIVKKILRTAMCIYGYFGFKTGSIIFAAPKINPAVFEKLVPCLIDIQKLLLENGFEYKIRLFANEEFGEKVLQPVVAATAFTADTSELFMRSLQLYNMFSHTNKPIAKKQNHRIDLPKENKVFKEIEVTNPKGLSEMKIGILARSILTKMLQNEAISPEEIQQMQTEDYSKRTFDLQYPLLRKVSLSNGKKPDRYWAGVVETYGEKYFICSEWYETAANNDRPYFMKWLELINSPKIVTE
jgi:hypothetical protein